jgi:hypothetical protein
MARFVRRERISREALLDAIARAERGLIDAELGGGLIKQRVARAGKGRSGGYRMIIAYRQAGRSFFLYGFAKSKRENIEEAQVKVIRELGAALLGAKDGQIARMIEIAELEEIADESQIN